MNKALALVPSFLIVMSFFVGSVALANTVYNAPSGVQYSVPTGFQPYGNFGAFYNPSTNTYYDAYSGMMSQIIPTGPAATNQNGLYTIPAGYSSSVYGTYYGGSNGVYYNPINGAMSYTLPPGGVVLGNVTYYNVAAVYPNNYQGNPYLPNTGAGGDAAATVVVLIFSAVIALVGFSLLRKGKYA